MAAHKFIIHSNMEKPSVKVKCIGFIRRIFSKQHFDEIIKRNRYEVLYEPELC